MEYALQYKFIWIDYTNYKGVRRIRQIMPLRLVFGATPYHAPQQWLLECIDIEDAHKIKMFAMADIHGMNTDKDKLEAAKAVSESQTVLPSCGTTEPSTPSPLTATFTTEPVPELGGEG